MKKTVNDLTRARELPAINLVGTRCTNGNHLALRRWYGDHVHLLLAAPELQEAQLHRCTQIFQGAAPDYFCIYSFANHDDFLAFEHGQPKAQATQLTNAAEGRSSIEIVQRTQYQRWLHRHWPAPSGKQSSIWRLAVCIQTEAAWSLDAQRGLADQLQALQSCSPMVCTQVYSNLGVAHQAFIALDFSGGDAASVWPLLQHFLGQPAMYGQPMYVQIDWAARAELVQAWLR